MNPLQPAAHRLAARAAEQLGTEAVATESYRALLKLDPLDPAELHHRLGRIALRRGDAQTARREALWALERTPRYRDAQKLLLEAARAGERPPEPPLLEGSP